MKENEINACNDFIKILQKIKGVDYYIESWPEEENRGTEDTEDVEVILASKDEDGQFPRIAVEHTIIDAHENQIRYVEHLYDIVTEIDRRCQEKLPTDHYFALTIPPALVRGTRKEINLLISEMSNWVLNIAKTSTIDQFRKCVSRLYNEHEVSLTCGNPFSKLNIKVGMMPTEPKEPEKERQKRFHRAINEKLPKLIKYKEKGYATALLLEDVSFSYTNPGDNLKYLIPNQYLLEFQLKTDYVVIFVSNQKKMIIGSVWKEEFQLYKEIPDNRRISFHQ